MIRAAEGPAVVVETIAERAAACQQTHSGGGES